MELVKKSVKDFEDDVEVYEVLFSSEYPVVADVLQAISNLSPHDKGCVIVKDKGVAFSYKNNSIAKGSVQLNLDLSCKINRMYAYEAFGMFNFVLDC